MHSSVSCSTSRRIFRRLKVSPVKQNPVTSIRYSMRCILLFSFLLLSLQTNAQKIECRDDSILINGFSVTVATGKSTLDSLLQTKGKERTQTGHNDTRKIQITSYTYKRLGLVFRKSIDDTSLFSIRIKLSRHSDPTVDMRAMATQRFKGDLYFANTHMNKIKQLEQLQELKNCKITYLKQPIEVPNYPLAGVVGASVFYHKRSMHVSLDFLTDRITHVDIK